MLFLDERNRLLIKGIIFYIKKKLNYLWLQKFNAEFANRFAVDYWRIANNERRTALIPGALATYM